jgi:diguanylate cyclase (GGDEF)-like protein
LDTTLDALHHLDADDLCAQLADLSIAASRSAPLDAARCGALMERAVLLDSLEVEAWTRVLRAALHMRDEELPAAAAELSQARCIFEGLAHHKGHIICLWRLGAIWIQVGDLHSTRLVVERGLELTRAHGERLLEGILLVNMAFTWGSEGKPALYHELSEQALAIFEELGADDRRAHTLCNMAGALARMKQYDRAEETYLRALLLIESQPNPYLRALITGGLGELAFAQRPPEAARAASLIREASAALSAAGCHYDAIRQELMLSVGLMDAGIHEDARTILDEIILHCEARGFRALLYQALSNKADTLRVMGRHAEAFDALKSASSLRDDLLYEETRQRFAVLRDAQLAADLAQHRLQAKELATVNQQLRAALVERDLLNARLALLARTDTLTQLLNRQGLADAAPAMLRGRAGPSALLVIDLDGFKAINDAWGHHVGDEVLIMVAQRCAEAAQPDGLACRLGGDEFLLLIAADMDSARARAAALEAAIRAPFASSAATLHVGLSLGVCAVCAPDELELAMRQADALMYRRKAANAHQNAGRSGSPAPQALQAR